MYRYQVIAQVLNTCKKERKWKYLFYSEEMREEGEEEIESWEGRVKSIKNEINKLQREMQQANKGKSMRELDMKQQIQRVGEQ